MTVVLMLAMAAAVAAWVLAPLRPSVRGPNERGASGRSPGGDA